MTSWLFFFQVGKHVISTDSYVGQDDFIVRGEYGDEEPSQHTAGGFQIAS